MEIRILQEEEIKSASGLSRYVFDICLRNRMEYPQTIAFVEEYITDASLRSLHEACELILWGAFDGEQLVAVSGMQRNGLITMLYVLPQYQNRGYGCQMLTVMRNYAKDVCGFSKVNVNANPAWTAFFFKKKGFLNLNANQDMKAPFVPMYALLGQENMYEKRKVPKKWIVLAAISSVLLVTCIGCLFMISYLF